MYACLKCRPNDINNVKLKRLLTSCMESVPWDKTINFKNIFQIVKMSILLPFKIKQI